MRFVLGLYFRVLSKRFPRQKGAGCACKGACDEQNQSTAGAYPLVSRTLFSIPVFVFTDFTAATDQTQEALYCFEYPWLGRKRCLDEEHCLLSHRRLVLQDPDIVRVVVSHLSLSAAAPLLRNDAIQMLFVEYKFLGVPLEETETPFSLPKPQPDTQIVYNFTKGLFLIPVSFSC